MLHLDTTELGVRALPPYQVFLKAQRQFVLDRYRRLSKAQGHESSGIKLLRYILQFVDIDYLNSQSNNYDRYRYHLRYIRKELYDIFDQVQRGKSFRHLFFAKGKYLTEEYLLPVEDVNTIIHLPLDTEDWNVWKTVKPLRLWSYDSNEYTINLINDQVHFKELNPSYCIELLDVVALVFKYYIWLKYQRNNEPAKELATFIPQQLFLHKYVFCDWCWDLTDAWLMNMFSNLMDPSATDRDFNYSALDTEVQWGWIALNSESGFRYLRQLLHDSERNMRPEIVFASKILMQGSIYDRIRSINEELSLPIYAQYDWLRWLRDKSLYNFYCRVWANRPDLPTSKSLFVNWRRDFKRILNHRPWNVCNNVILKTQIETEMTEFYQWLESVRS